MTVIIMTSNPIIEQQAIDMNLATIATENSVVLWDLSKIYGREDKVSHSIAGTVKIQSVEELDQKLGSVVLEGRTVVITNILIPRLKAIYKTIKKYPIDIININKESMATWLRDTAMAQNSSNISSFQHMKKKFMQIPAVRAIGKGIFYHGVKYDYLLSSYNFFPEESRNFVKIHNVKYDEYLEARQQEPIVEGRYILFVDAAYVGHSMFSTGARPLDEAEYISALNRYFELLEKKYEMPVVISLHPKSDYPEGAFGDRVMLKYQTPVLLQHADRVISHYSTSLIAAALLQKPMKVMSSKEILSANTRYCALMGLKLAELLHLDVVDLDDPDLGEFTIDLQAYEDFIDKYVINKEKKEISNGEIILEFLRGL